MFLALTKWFCITFILAAFCYQVESLPAGHAAAQSGQPADAQAVPTVEQPLADAKTPATVDDTGPAADKIKRAEWVQIFINSFVALIVLWQSWIYYQQRTIMQRQIETMTVSERAYIGVKSVAIENFTLGMEPIVRVTILNGGRTPAWRLIVPTTLRIGDEFPPERPELGDVIGSVFLPAGMDATYRYPFTFNLTQKWKEAIESGARKVFVSGEIHYDDCWGNKQIVPFKLAYNSKAGRWSEYKDPDTVKPVITITP